MALRDPTRQPSANHKLTTPGQGEVVHIPQTRDEIRELYRKRARRYDLSAWLFSLAGINLVWYRRQTVASLAIQRGDTVVDLACGTGLNFSILQDAIGPEGRIIGVDLTDAMLEQARHRVQRAGWKNVQLIQGDLAEYECPRGTGAIVSTLGLTLVPDYDGVVKRGATALRQGGRLAVFDLKRPAYWPEWLVRAAVSVNRPFGVSLDLATRHPWESVRQHLHEVEFQEFYGGALCLSVGERQATGCSTPHGRE
jgi:demethylmenaquinone methyltransferase/2-methoxy-6-polyprenyl-1,4-benzoquinol methylase